MLFRVFTSALLASVSCAFGALVVWLLGELNLPPALQAHNPFAPPVSSLFQETQTLFLRALAAVGAMAGFLLPARHYGSRKLAELEATARALALAWGFVAGAMAFATVLVSPSIWPFVVLSALTGGNWLLAASMLRAVTARPGSSAWRALAVQHSVIVVPAGDQRLDAGTLPTSPRL